MAKMYFYTFKDKEFNIMESKRITVDKFYLDNGKTRSRNEEKHPNDVAYGSPKEIIMFSYTNNKIEDFFKTGIAFINKQLSKYKRQFDRLDFDKDKEKVQNLERIIGTYHELLRDMFSYKMDNNLC